jgi:hypothetical protein
MLHTFVLGSGGGGGGGGGRGPGPGAVPAAGGGGAGGGEVGRRWDEAIRLCRFAKVGCLIG